VINKIIYKCIHVSCRIDTGNIPTDSLRRHHLLLSAKQTVGHPKQKHHRFNTKKKQMKPRTKQVPLMAREDIGVRWIRCWGSPNWKVIA